MTNLDYLRFGIGVELGLFTDCFLWWARAVVLSGDLTAKPGFLAASWLCLTWAVWLSWLANREERSGG